jgi:hypothetical protein
MTRRSTRRTAGWRVWTRGLRHERTSAAGSDNRIGDDRVILTLMSLIADTLKNLENERLRALVNVDAGVLDELHASDFILVHPSGGTWSKAQYVGGILSGEINYRKLEPVSDIEVMADEKLAVLRYQSAIEIHIRGQEPGPLECWHTDCYRRAGLGSPWQVVWSQATECV